MRGGSYSSAVRDRWKLLLGCCKGTITTSKLHTRLSFFFKLIKLKKLKKKLLCFEIEEGSKRIRIQEWMVIRGAVHFPPFFHQQWVPIADSKKKVLSAPFPSCLPLA